MPPYKTAAYYRRRAEAAAWFRGALAIAVILAVCLAFWVAFITAMATAVGAWQTEIQTESICFPEEGNVWQVQFTNTEPAYENQRQYERLTMVVTVEGQTQTIYPQKSGLFTVPESVESVTVTALWLDRPGVDSWQVSRPSFEKCVPVATTAPPTTTEVPDVTTTTAGPPPSVPPTTTTVGPPVTAPPTTTPPPVPPVTPAPPAVPVTYVPEFTG